MKDLYIAPKTYVTMFYVTATRTDGDSPFLEELGKAKTTLLDPQN